MPDRELRHVGHWTEHPDYLDIVWRCADDCPHPSHQRATQEAA